jgi:GT2 family glycosyltransferase/glycosyltransferase involved in cell wall biosynthesis
MNIPSLNNLRCTIILPVFNGLSLVVDCIESVRRWTDLDRHRLLIVDDASDATTADFLDAVTAECPQICLLRTEANQGFLAACNRGLATVETATALLLNSDVVVSPGWLDALLACMDSDERIAAVNPLTNRAEQIALAMPPGANFLGINEALQHRPGEALDVVTPVGFCLLLRKRALDEVGAFDPVFGRGYCEESDLCMRLLEAGWRTVVADNAYVYHRGGGTFVDRDRRYRKNRRIFDERWKAEYRRRYRAFQKDDPLGAIRCDFASGSRWHPRPMVWQTGRAMLEARQRRNWPGVVEQAARGAMRTLRSREPKVDHAVVGRSTRQGQLSVTYLLDRMVIAGGVLSVIQLVNELILQGVEARIATRFVDPMVLDWSRLYTRPMVFRRERDLIDDLPPTDVVVATLWKTAPWVAELMRQGRARAAAYFLQDYEPWFFPESQPEARARVQQTFGLIPNRIVKSDWLREKLAAEGFETHKIRLGMDLGRFYPRDSAHDRPTVIAMARPGTAYRGFETLVETLVQVRAQVPRVRIVLFGSRDLLHRELPFEFEDAGVVHDMDRMARLYSSADVFVDTSDFQGFGRCGLEAMACGTACVLSSAGGVREYASDGHNSLLIEPGDPEAFAGAIGRLLEDAALRARLVEAGRQTAQAFDHKREARETQQYFSALVGMENADG